MKFVNIKRLLSNLNLFTKITLLLMVLITGYMLFLGFGRQPIGIVYIGFVIAIHVAVVVAFNKYKTFLGKFFGTIFLTPVFMIVSLLFVYVYTEINIGYWDYRVAQMCKEEGGVTVYEKVYISREKNPEYFTDKAAVDISREMGDKDGENYDYFYITKKKYLKETLPVIAKRTYFFYRKNDQKLLGKVVNFFRSGGSFPIPPFGEINRGFSCKDLNISIDEHNTIFIIEEAKGEY